jgi:adenylyltransferase/sulfurtransferase
MELADFIERFSRQVLLNEIGVKGQIRLFRSRVAIIGCGATGSGVAELLARAGVGFIRIIDRDFVELSNLHRTHLFKVSDALEYLPKAIACKRHLKEINELTSVECIVENVSPDNIEELISDVDLVIDGTDNFETRLLINEACITLKKPWIMQGVERWYGMVKFIDAEKTSCFKCIIPRDYMQREENVCEILGVINVAVSLTTSITATLALKYLLGLPVEEELFIINTRNLSIDRVKVSKNPNCSACIHKRLDFLGRKGKERIRFACAANMVEVLPEKPIKVEVSRLLKSSIFENIRVFDRFAHIRIEDFDILILDNGKMLIRGIRDLTVAEKVYNYIFTILEKHGVISK